MQRSYEESAPAETKLNGMNKVTIFLFNPQANIIAQMSSVKGERDHVSRI